MAASLNRATLIGHLGADPESRSTQDGRLIVTFSLATSERWKDRNTGQNREATEWHRIVIFSEPLAKIAQQYLKKGAPVLIEGQIKTRKWQGQDGQDRYSTEIVLQGYDAMLKMLGSSGTGNRAGGNGAADYGYDADRAAGRSASGGAGAPPSGGSPDFNDDIPF